MNTRHLSLRALCLALSVSLGSGCATVINQTKQKVNVASTPPGAQVQLDGANQGTTPLALQLKRKTKSYAVRLTLDGYEPYEVTLNRGVSAWLFGNAVIGGLIGLGVDVISGGMYKLKPKEINAELKPVGQTG